MAAPSTNDGALSKTLLQMKFMQKTASKLQQEVEEEEIGALEEQWVIESLPPEYLALMETLETPEEGTAEHELFEYTNSITVLEQLNFGRMSFQGMNPEVEILMRTEAEEDLSPNQETSVTDEDMANQYSSFVRNMDKKFKTKRERPQESSEDEDDNETPKKQKTPNKIVGQVKTFLKPKEYQ